MYEIIKHINNSTKIAMKDGQIFVLKRIAIEDLDIYQKLLKIDSPYIIKFYEITTIDEELYIVEEFVQGTTLASYIEQNDKISDEEAKEYMLQICRGLDKVHSKGIIHRDINPNNIMLDQNNHIKIIDFGISRLEKSDKTTDTHILGTPGYASPEQYGFHQTSKKADIYALGVLLNYMKTKCLPNERLTNDTFSEIVLKCTQIDENRRYNDITELMLAIQKKARIHSILSTIPGIRQKIWWHEAIAIVYYIFTIFLFIMTFVTYNTAKDIIINSAIFFFALVVPVPILTNYKGWVESAPFTRNKRRNIKIAIQIAFAVISEVIACILILIDQGQLMVC